MSVFTGNGLYPLGYNKCKALLRTTLVTSIVRDCAAKSLLARPGLLTYFIGHVAYIGGQ